MNSDPSPIALDPAQLRQLFNDTAGVYDRVDVVGSFGRALPYRTQALERAGLKPGARVLDVACGTGLMSLAALRATGGKVTLTGVDPSPGMAAHARARVTMEFHEGIAEALPVPDAAFDFLMMGYALRHVPDWDIAFREFARVLRPGGRLLILELTKPQNIFGRALFHAYFGWLLPVLGCIVSGNRGAWRLYRYYWRTMDHARPPSQVVAALQRAGLAAEQATYGPFTEITAVRN